MAAGSATAAAPAAAAPPSATIPIPPAAQRVRRPRAAGVPVSLGDDADDRRASLGSVGDVHPGVDRNVRPRYMTPTPRRRSPTAKASAPSSCREPGGRPDDDGGPTGDRGRLVGRGQTPRDRRAGRVLGRHTHAAGAHDSPIAAAAGSSTSSTTASNDPGGEDLVDGGLGLGGDVNSAAATNRSIIRARWAPPRSRRPRRAG